MTKEKEKKGAAFARPILVSAELAEIVGKGPMPRTEVTKLLWVYIKKHKLQDTVDKRQINPDQKLAKVLGSTAPINMFKMTAKVAKHIKQPELAAAKK